jgi:hypothetical protein
MALDEADHRLFVATRVSAQVAVYDTKSGRLVATVPAVQDADDLYYDASRKRIYVSGGEGYISVIRQNDADHYESLAKIQSALGARTAGYFGKGRKGFDASTWAFLPAPVMVLKCGSTPCRTSSGGTQFGLNCNPRSGAGLSADHMLATAVWHRVLRSRQARRSASRLSWPSRHLVTR